MRSTFVVLICWMMMALPAAAVTIDATLSDPAQEMRAKALFSEFRCVVCAGQPLADSDAQVAQDLRRTIRDMVSQGKSDADITEYLVERYGESIRSAPPLNAQTAWLWFAPLGFVAFGVAVAFISLRRRSTST